MKLTFVMFESDHLVSAISYSAYHMMSVHVLYEVQCIGYQVHNDNTARLGLNIKEYVGYSVNH